MCVLACADVQKVIEGLEPALGFSSTGLSAIRTLMMMVGEFDFGAIFGTPLVNPAKRERLHFPGLALLFLMLFVLLVPVLIMNLLVRLSPLFTCLISSMNDGGSESFFHVSSE